MSKIFVTVEEAISRYLWNETSQPANINDEKYIRLAKDQQGKPVLGDPIYIDATEYMTDGGGRFLSAGQFNVFKKYFSGEGNFQNNQTNIHNK